MNTCYCCHMSMTLTTNQLFARLLETDKGIQVPFFFSTAVCLIVSILSVIFNNNCSLFITLAIHTNVVHVKNNAKKPY